MPTVQGTKPLSSRTGETMNETMKPGDKIKADTGEETNEVCAGCE
jgi:hypothetical protein